MTHSSGDVTISDYMSYGGLTTVPSVNLYRRRFVGVRHILILVIAFLALCDDLSYAWDPSDDLDEWYFEDRFEAETNGPEIRDPFFEFVIERIEGDSLGVWSREQLIDHIEASGRPSKLPIDRVIRFVREEIVEQETALLGHVSTARLISLELDADLSLPLPYSILGYHPGTLHVSRILQAQEHYLSGVILRVFTDDDWYKSWVPGVFCLTLEDGHVILDVDGWVDRLLGKKLDDTWLEAFVLARIEDSRDPSDDGLNGLALGRSRKDRPLSGSFDFRTDKVLPNGRPIARALARYCRQVIAFPDDKAWSWEP